MGADPAAMSRDATFTNVQITPTRSIFVMQAGPMNITITFLSPVEVRRSILSNDITSPSQDTGTISPTTGSSNQFHFHTCLWRLNPWTERAIPCNCTRTSLQVWLKRTYLRRV